MADDTGDAIPRLHNLYMQFPQVRNDWVRAAAARVVEQGKRNAREQLYRNPTGTLSGSITYNMLGEGEAEVGPGMIYAAIHEFGGTIRPVRARALVFEVGGRTVVTQQVTMPKRPYMLPAMETVQSEFGDLGARLINEAASE